MSIPASPRKVVAAEEGDKMPTVAALSGYLNVSKFVNILLVVGRVAG